MVFFYVIYYLLFSLMIFDDHLSDTSSNIFSINGDSVLQHSFHLEFLIRTEKNNCLQFLIYSIFKSTYLRRNQYNYNYFLERTLLRPSYFYIISSTFSFCDLSMMVSWHLSVNKPLNHWAFWGIFKTFSRRSRLALLWMSPTPPPPPPSIVGW